MLLDSIKSLFDPSAKRNRRRPSRTVCLQVEELESRLTPSNVAIDLSSTVATSNPDVFGGNSSGKDSAHASVLAANGMTAARGDYFLSRIVPNTTDSAYLAAMNAGSPAGSVADPNTWNWPSTTDFSLDAAYGFRPMMIMDYGLQWNNDGTGNPPTWYGPPTDYTTYLDVVKKVYQHYPRPSQVEIWNEPDGSWFVYMDPAKYANFYKQVAGAIRSIDPTVPIGGPAVSNEGQLEPYVDAMAAAGIPSNEVDFLSYHSYKSGTEDPGPIAYVRSLYPAAQVDVTEWNWDGNGTGNDGDFASSVGWFGMRLISQFELGLGAYYYSAYPDSALLSSIWINGSTTLMAKAENWLLMSKQLGLGAGSAALESTSSSGLSAAAGAVNSAGHPVAVMANYSGAQSVTVTFNNIANGTWNLQTFMADHGINNAASPIENIEVPVTNGTLVHTFNMTDYSTAGIILTPVNTLAPSPPTGLTASAGNSQVVLSWNASSGASTYDLYRGTSSGGETLVNSGITGTSFTDTGLTNATGYYYEVSAVNSAGESGKSIQVLATPGNLIQDPSFENQSNTKGPLVAPWFVQNPSGENVGVEIGTTAHTGSKLAYWYQPGTGTGFTDVYQTVAVAPNTNYTLTGWFDNNDTGTFTGGEFGARTTGGSVIQETAIPEIGPGNSSASYRQLTVTFNSGSNSQVVVFGGYTPQQYSWLHMDDVSLTANTGGIAIDAGGGAAGSFVADTDFSGGKTYTTSGPINTSGVTSPAPQSVYQSERYGTFTYTAPNLTPGASYSVRLDFAEIYWNSAGQRLFNVSINGQQVLSNFDIYVTAGGKDIAIAESFTATANASGQIVISFAPTAASPDQNAKVSGIEVSPVSGSIAIDAGGGAAGSFVADTDFSGGKTYTTSGSINTSGVTSPAPQSVYQSERYGTFTYTAPNLTPGASYSVRLDFAEIYWNSAGQRLFNVSINGQQVLSNFDIYATAGGKDIAIAESFTATANASGQIVISFAPTASSPDQNAKVSGIEIAPANLQLLAGAPIANSTAPNLTVRQLAPVEAQAFAAWEETGALSATQDAALHDVQFVIANLPGSVLGETVGHTIYIDSNAAGYGWSLGSQVVPTEVDLRTVVEHELGHVLGLADLAPGTHPGDLMDELLPGGVRRSPSAYDVFLLQTTPDSEAAGYLVGQLKHRRG